MDGASGGLDQPAAVVPHQLTIGEDGLSARDGAADEAAERAADVGAELVAIEEHVSREGVGGGEVNEGEVGVVAYGYFTLVGEAEAVGNVGGSQSSDLFERQRGLAGEEDR